MSQPNFEKLITKARAINSQFARGSSNEGETSETPHGAAKGAIEPAANLLEIFHARNLRDTIAKQVVRLEEQSCAVGWCVGMAEFEPLYCDSTLLPRRDPLNAGEVSSHYVDLVVAMDHLLVQLGDLPAER